MGQGRGVFYPLKGNEIVPYKQRFEVAVQQDDAPVPLLRIADVQGRRPCHDEFLGHNLLCGISRLARDGRRGGWAVAGMPLLLLFVVEVVEGRFAARVGGVVLFVLLVPGNAAVEGMPFLSALPERFEPFGLSKFVRVVSADSLLCFHRMKLVG